MKSDLNFKPAKEEKRQTLKYGTKKHPTIVKWFNKTPKSIVCPHFYELNAFYGCRFNCAYCYLQGTFYGNKEPRKVPWKDVRETLYKVLGGLGDGDGLERPYLFNTGELADSLVYPDRIKKIVDRFEKQDKHKVLILTKSSNVNFLLEKLRNQAVVSFSINASSVADRWELDTASPEKRIEAGKKVSEAGYETRVRIDPIFPVENRKEKYGNIIEKLLSKFTPERITLGTPRGLNKTKRFAEDDSWWKVAFEETPSENSGWGKKIAFPVRKKIYSFIIDKLQGGGYKNPIALCKETKEMWESLGKDPGGYYGKNSQRNWDKCKCNCKL